MCMIGGKCADLRAKNVELSGHLPLDSVDTVIQYASTMTWKGKHPVVELVTTTYQTGVKLTKKAMKVVETQLSECPLWTSGSWISGVLPQLSGIVNNS